MKRVYSYRCEECSAVFERAREIKNRRNRARCICGGVASFQLRHDQQVLRRPVPAAHGQTGSFKSVVRLSEGATNAKIAIHATGRSGIGIDAGPGTSAVVTSSEFIGLDAGIRSDGAHIVSTGNLQRNVANPLQASNGGIIESNDDEFIQ